MNSPGPWTPDQNGPTNPGYHQPGQPYPPPEQPKKKFGCMKWGLIALGVFVVLIVIAGIFGNSDDESVAVEEVTTSAVPTSESAAEPSPTPEPTPESTPEPEPEPEVDPVQQQQDELTEAIQDKVENAQVSFRDSQVDVTFPIADNLTRGFIITGAQADTIDILKAVKDSGWQGGNPWVVINGTFNMVDAYGGESDDEILMLTYSPETMQRVNPGGLQNDRVWAIADESFVHPELRK